MNKRKPPTLDTVEGLLAQCAELFTRTDHGDMTAEDSRELNMKLAIIRQCGDLIKPMCMRARSPRSRTPWPSS